MPRSLFDTTETEPIKRPPDAMIADAKERHPGMILVFRIGNSYELFDNDAELATRLLGLELCRASRSIVRFPVQALEAHIRKLLHSGHRLAICEQGEATT